MNSVLYYRTFFNSKRTLVFFFILIILIITVDIKSKSQNNLSLDTLRSQYIKSSFEENIAFYENNDFLPSAIETFGANIFVFLLNKYALGDPSWRKISFKTLRNNLSLSFVWDSDGFEMNLLFHPYSGALS